MRAHGRKYEVGRRFAILISVAAAGVMALGAQTGAAASEGVVSYDTEVTIHRDPGRWHGYVTSKVSKCMKGREVILFRKRPGPDRKLGATRSYRHHPVEFEWKVVAPERGRVYAKVTPKVGDGFVCRADYSHVYLNGGS